MQLIQSVDDKKRTEEDEITRKQEQEARRQREEEEKLKKDKEAEEYRKQTFCAWHANLKANYTCGGCNKRFCFRCLGKEEGENAYCKACWSSLKYKSHIEGKKQTSATAGSLNPETQALIDSLPSSSTEDMIHIIRKLGADRSSETVQVLIDKLEHEEERVRTEAAKSLGKIGDPRGVIPLCNKLGDPADNMRKACIVSLGFLKDIRAFPHLEQLRYIERDEAIVELLQDALENIKKVKEEHAYDLIRKLATEDWNIRTQIIEELVKLGSEAVVPLIKILVAKNPNMVMAALETLSTLGDKRAVEPTLPLLKSYDENIRIAAIDALARFKDKSVLPELLSLRDDESPSVRVAFIDTLRLYSSEEIIEPLINGLFDPDKNVKNKAIEILKTIDLPAIAPGMVRILINKKDLRQVAFEILEKKGEHAQEEMIAGLNECEDDEGRLMLINLLSLRGDRDSIDRLKEFTKRKDLDKEVRNAAKDAATKISKRLGITFADSISRFMRNINKKCTDFTSKAQQKMSDMTKKEEAKEALPTCSVCKKVIRKQYPELKGELVWQLENRSYCKKCGKLYCPKCARKSDMGMGMTLISCPVCKKDKKDDDAMNI